MTRARRTDRWVILTALGAVTALAWIYIVLDAQRMSGTSMASAMHSMVEMKPWTGTDVVLRLSMWAVMMVAMMVPSAAPMTLVYAAVARKAASQADPVAPTAVFVAGYLMMWSLFSVAATAAQWGLDRMALLSPAMASKSPLLGGALLIAAGAYQLTPYKRACLEHCRAPAHYISQHWRPGVSGSFRMGLRFGAYCVGCCWILMALLFVGGVMNFVWVAAIAVFILVEKTLPFAETLGRVVGAGLILVGVLTLLGLLTLG